jgi:hypothetical protein
MFLNDLNSEIDGILMAVSEEIGVSESRYQEAKDHYSAVGDWLDAQDSPLKAYQPHIYPQGSFALGTAVRPLNDEDYDVDTVCLLSTPPIGLSQQRLKTMIGERLKQHATYAEMIDPQDGGRRCWTLRYADGSQFHIDILPAIPDGPQRMTFPAVPQWLAESAIRITDKTTWSYGAEWPKSNPTGYARWFEHRMSVMLQKAKEVYAGRLRASVTLIQDYEVRTPLQRAVQILKRHRDVYCAGDDKPISIIITTLAGQVYQNESTLLETLRNIVPKMRQELYNGRRVNEWWVPNPVSPEENFADKWKETPRKAEVFLGWLDTVEKEFADLLSEQGFQEIGDYLAKAYGARDASRAMERRSNELKKALPMVRTGGAFRPLPQSAIDLTTFNVPHRQAPVWPEALSASVTINARWRVAGAWKDLRGGASHVMRKAQIRFRATTTVQGLYEVYWQVVNTGADARVANGLRGNIASPEDPSDPLKHAETTLYRGRHWIECFIVKNGRCIARSGPFVVNIV